jgi:hypothetical protein
MINRQSFKVSILYNVINGKIWKVKELILIYVVYRCGFLGLLHMDVFLQRLEQVEFLNLFAVSFFKCFAVKEFTTRYDTSST